MKKSILIIFLTFILLINCQNSYASAMNIKNNDESSKIIYLTFDDGPGGKVTEEVLDILKSENINATFFLIGDQIKDQEPLVKRIYEDGNAIGLHSMTHSKCKLYSCDDNFINEMTIEQELLESIIDKKIYLVRFPFGCNNNSYHLKSSLVDSLHEKGFKIYDWNVDSTDGANHNACPDTLFNKAKSDKDTIFLLMHCGYINKNSAKALPSIIKYYKDNGYSFNIIDDNTEEM